jgi:hypothetical protein
MKERLIKYWPTFKPILKDVLKFYVYFVILYGLLFFIVTNYPRLIDPFSVDFNSYMLLGKATGSYTFFLVCFGVFFADPPKSFQHVASVAVLLCLTFTSPFLYYTVLGWILSVLYFCVYILLAWGSSVAWHRFKMRKNKQQ